MDASAEILLAEATGSVSPGRNVEALGLSRLVVPAGFPSLPVRYFLVVRGTPALTLTVAGSHGFSQELSFALGEHVPAVTDTTQTMVDGELHLPASRSQDFLLTLEGDVPVRSVRLELVVDPQAPVPVWLESWRAHLFSVIRTHATTVVRTHRGADLDTLTSELSARVTEETSLEVDAGTLRGELSKLV